MRDAAQAFLSKREKAIQQVRNRDQNKMKRLTMKTRLLQKGKMAVFEYLNLSKAVEVQPK